MRDGKPQGIKADGYSGRQGHAFVKRRKRRLERRKARADPACVPTYGRYRGYWS